jgi:Contractile injection system tape measure protein
VPAPAVHRIRRHRWNIRTASSEEAFAIRAWVRASWEDELLPAIDRAFAREDRGDDMVHIPRLEIRLTVAAGHAGRGVLAELLEETVARELSGLVAGGATRAGALPPERRSKGEDRVATLIHYLRHGTLPWVAAGVRPPEDTVGELQATARGELARLAHLVARGSPARHELFRLLQLLGHEAVTSLPLLAPDLPPLWNAALASLLEPETGSMRAPQDESARPSHAWHLRLTAAAALLAQARLAVSALDAGAIAAVVRDAVGAGEYESLYLFLPMGLGQRTGAGQGTAPAIPEVRTQTPTNRVASGGPPRPRPRPDTFAVPAAGVRGFPPITPDSVSASPFVTGRSGELPLAVVHAGLVLLHPYIERLFSATGVAAGRVVPDGTRARAAALLHQLAGGREEIHELELGLVKVLLGMGPEDSLPVAEGLLGPTDLEECTALLEAVIEHWGVLGRTSVAGLRASFLQRPGLLRRLESGWSLHVEPAGYDVLLAHLPWSISVVRLPWMPEPVYPEWSTTP